MLNSASLESMLNTFCYEQLLVGDKPIKFASFNPAILVIEEGISVCDSLKDSQDRLFKVFLPPAT